MSLEIIERPSTSGPGIASLLFVHGSYAGAWCWDEYFLPYFAAAGYNCHAVSVRGHGASGGRERLHEFGIADYLADVSDILAGIRGPVAVIAHSTGGAVAQLLVRDERATLSGLVLLASVPPAGTGPESIRLMLRHFRELRALRKFNRGAAEYPAGLFFSEALGPADRDRYAALMQPESDKVNLAVTRRIVRGRAPIGLPVLVVGSPADKVISVRSVRATARAWGVEPVLLAGMSHMSMTDPDWERVAVRVEGFLAGLFVPQRRPA